LGERLREQTGRRIPCRYPNTGWELSEVRRRRLQSGRPGHVQLVADRPRGVGLDLAV